MNNPNVSIIVPVYKAEDTIKRCVNSILSQRYTNWELILVDDGSPDNSGKICDEYSLMDNRIKVIHKQNEGVSIARNTGLDNAKGYWVTFVDSDDWLEGDVFSIVENATPNSNLIVFDNIDVYKDKTIKNHLPAKVLSGNDLKNTFWHYLFNPVFLGPWSKFFRMDIIKRYNVRYEPEIKWAEDRLFNITFISHIDCIQFAGMGSYMYLQPTNTQTIMKYNVTIRMIEDVYEKMRDVTNNMQFRRIGYSYSVLWQKVEKISLIDPNYNEEERKAFYRKNFSFRTLLDMKWYHIPLFVLCALFPHSICKGLMSKYLRIKS